MDYLLVITAWIGTFGETQVQSRIDANVWRISRRR